MPTPNPTTHPRPRPAQRPRNYVFVVTGVPLNFSGPIQTLYRNSPGWGLDDVLRIQADALPVMRQYMRQAAVAHGASKGKLRYSVEVSRIDSPAESPVFTGVGDVQTSQFTPPRYK